MQSLSSWMFKHELGKLRDAYMASSRSFEQAAQNAEAAMGRASSETSRAWESEYFRREEASEAVFLVREAFLGSVPIALVTVVLIRSGLEVDHGGAVLAERRAMGGD